MWEYYFDKWLQLSNEICVIWTQKLFGAQTEPLWKSIVSAGIEFCPFNEFQSVFTVNPHILDLKWQPKK
jgi:hypothetical protein